MLERIREMMSQVDQSGRLAVVGQLSAYFAHEIRNPLTSIKLNLQRLKRWTLQGRVPEFCLEPLEISLREVERLSASVSDVLQLSKAQDSPQTVLSLHDQVEEAVHLLIGRFMGQGVELRLDLDADADLVTARSGQVKSVILNLMVNALEAQPRGGFLEIRSELTRSPAVQGPAVSLRFKDGGAGVPPELRDRIFEPFFTTKAGGSGIGLAVAARAVRDNGGRLSLETSPDAGSGAEFVMVLPLAAVDPLGVAVGEDTTREWGESRAQRPDNNLPFPPAPLGPRRGRSATSNPEGGKKVVPLSLFGPEETK
jgi:signal transduction histidine kinase